MIKIIQGTLSEVNGAIRTTEMASDVDSCQILQMDTTTVRYETDGYVKVAYVEKAIITIVLNVVTK